MLAGTDELSRHANDPPRDKLPPDAQKMRTWALAQLGHVAAGVNTVEADELAALHADRIKTEYPLGDLPLIVLTRGLSEEEGSDSKAFEEEHRHDHSVLAAMSRKGKLVIATHSGHHIQLDEPGLVVSSIREVLAAEK
jgi:hypothetical protein